MSKECLLSAVDLQNDLNCGTYTQLTYKIEDFQNSPLNLSLEISTNYNLPSND